MSHIIRAMIEVGIVMSASCLIAPSAAFAESKSNGRVPVAMLFGQPIHLDEFQPPTPWKTREGKTDAEYAAWLRDWQFEQVQTKIWSALTERFCAHRDCEPTEEEYQAFQQGMQRARAQHPLPNAHSQEPAIPPEEYQRAHTELQKQLQDPANTDEHRNELKQAIAQLEELKDKKLGEPTRNVAKVWIRAWKFNRALYRQYGGEVIWQQAGLEPLGAYKIWLEENEHNGAFTILDAALKERVWGYFKPGHVKVDQRFLQEMGLKDPFEKPWWLLEPPAGDHDPHVGREPELLTPH